MLIRPPRLPGTYEDRDMDCQEALEVALVDLIDGAIQAGWSEHESRQAIIGLVASFISR